MKCVWADENEDTIHDIIRRIRLAVLGISSQLVIVTTYSWEDKIIREFLENHVFGRYICTSFGFINDDIHHERLIFTHDHDYLFHNMLITSKYPKKCESTLVDNISTLPDVYASHFLTYICKDVTIYSVRIDAFLASIRSGQTSIGDNVVMGVNQLYQSYLSFAGDSKCTRQSFISKFNKYIYLDPNANI
jgi:hypothetical protein